MFLFYIYNNIIGDNMKVKIFDFEHEKDLESAINNFINNDIEVIDIKYCVSNFYDNKTQIYSFSALIMYKNSKSN